MVQLFYFTGKKRRLRLAALHNIGRYETEGLCTLVRHERNLYRVRVTAQEMRVCWPLEAGL